MRNRIVTCIVLGVALSTAIVSGGQSKALTGWSVPRTPDGRPDFQGVWANNGMTPLKRPKQWAGRATMTDAELADLKQRVQALQDGGDAFFADELILTALEGKEKFKSADTQTGNYDQTGCRTECSTTARRSSSIRPTAAFRRWRRARQSGRERSGERVRGGARPTRPMTCRSAPAASPSARPTSGPAIRATSRSRRGPTRSVCAPR